jgi:hypothetical protein
MVNKITGYIAILLVNLSLILVTSCDYEIMIVDFEFGHLPRVVYIAGVDSELDFTDVTLISTARDGFRNESSFDVFGPDWVTVEHFVDFDTPGVYEVEVVVHLSYDQFYITFFVQVIDEAIFNELSGRTE